MEMNGRASVGKRSRHINIRHFFVTDQMQKGNIQIRYRSTNDMIVDYVTKPLQGKKFQQFKAAILNFARIVKIDEACED